MIGEVKGRPWFFKGVKNVTNCETSEEVMHEAKLDFKVAKCPIVAKMPAILTSGQLAMTDESFLYGGDHYAPVENCFATYRTDKNIPLGFVKGRYEIVQNTDAFKFFDNAIGKDKAIWDTAGAFDNGKRVFVSAKLPGDITVNGKDKIENYLVFLNSHDGSSGVNILFTSVRIICQNCLPAAKRNADQFIRFRHTFSVHDNIQTAIDILGISRKMQEDAGEYYNHLATIKMTDDQVMDMIARVNLSDEEYSFIKMEQPRLRLMFARNGMVVSDANISTRKLNTMCNMLDYYTWGPGQREYKGTAWGAFNTITGYYANEANLDGAKRMDSLLYGNASNIMNKSFNLALDLALAS